MDIDYGVIGKRAAELSEAKKRYNQLFSEIRQVGEDLKSGGAFLAGNTVGTRGFQIGLQRLKTVKVNGGLDRLFADIAECAVLEQRIATLTAEQLQDGVE